MCAYKPPENLVGPAKAELVAACRAAIKANTPQVSPPHLRLLCCDIYINIFQAFDVILSTGRKA